MKWLMYLSFTSLIFFNSGCQLNATISGLESSSTIGTNIAISNVPKGKSNQAILNVGLEGEGYSAYKYIIGPADSVDCSSLSSYSSENSLNTNITDTLTSIPDGPVKLCVLGIKTDSQSTASTTEIVSKEWIKDTVSPTLTAISATTEVDSNNLNSVTVTGVCSEDGQSVQFVAPVTASTVCNSGNYSIALDLTNVQDGPLELSVRLLDEAGNQSTSTVSGIVKDVTAVAVLSFEKFGTKVVESNQMVSLKIVTSQVKPYDTIVSYFTNGDAPLGSLHNLLPGYVTLPAGQASVTIDVPALNNAVSDRTRRLIVSLSESSQKNVQIGFNSHHAIDFEDDETNANRSPIVDFSVDGNVMCVLHSNGHLRCWGNNNWGQVGDGTGAFRASPIRIGGTTTYKSVVSSGGPSTCATTTSDTVQCWGWGSGGQLGNGGSSQMNSPTTASGGELYTMVEGGGAHACGLTPSSKLRCWGYNLYGNVGNGTTSSQFSPVDIDSAENYINVGLGDGYFTCAITTNGLLKCWGRNDLGQLGDGTTTQRTTPVPIDATTTYSQVTGGKEHACGLTTLGKIKCWGKNTNGQIGDGSITNSLIPVAIDSATTYSKISGGGTATCGITSLGVLKCWGQITGALGTELAVDLLVPTVIDAGTTYTKVKTVGAITCGLTTTSDFKCFMGATANNGFGMGMSPYTNILPTAIVPTKSWKKVVRGNSLTCAIDSANKLFCWGSGAVGNGKSQLNLIPIAIKKDLNFTSVSTFGGTTCAITDAKKLWCWGINNNILVQSLVGIGTSSLVELWPVAIEPEVNFIKVSRGYDHTCALTEAGVAHCWGKNNLGQLNDGTIVNKGTPVVSTSGTLFKDISAGTAYTCGINVSDELYCWGFNGFGQLGTGNKTDSLIPVRIDATNLYSKVFASTNSSSNSTCGITTTGVLRCWGNNSGRQLGDGTTTERLTAVTIDSGFSYLEVQNSSGYSTCGRTTSQLVRCWGQNEAGQVGQATLATQASPVSVDGATTYISIAISGYTTCGITTSGAMKCWGSKTNGLFADGSSPIFALPAVWADDLTL